MKIAAILVAAGTGSRFGGATPKQLLLLNGKPVMRHAAEALLGHIDLLQPVGDAALIGAALAGIPHLPIVPGGTERQDSVRAGLEALRAHAPDIVLVHDAARPVIPSGTIEAVLEALNNYPGAIPALAVSDTLKRGANSRIMETVPRANLFRAQTPQGFRYQELLSLHLAAAREPALTDDAALLEAAGMEVALVPGAEHNIKLTLPADFARLQHVLGAGMIPRIGNGFDVHAMAEGRKMTLCGITIPFEKGLAGHSDADVGIHARGGRLSNADITLICERPKITPHAPAMRARLAHLLGVSTDLISVKATTTERLGFAGRGEGIAAQASVIILLPG
jgi:2-C-methyl-D-erythritol 4-phosphate cytidylyltransferase/2-C-methyl-D-erythritol 2,4-cyclodiphosphate synthase